ncbi:MAG TPA: hypothetical protein VFH95_06745 [Candidatus Kapabacteria bacterium]|nr:hypothetical protein [Candidatus Kapabacteria bacterium]
MRRIFDTIFLALGLAMLALFTTRYRMPFRLDDVVLMLWAQTHSALDAFNPIKGQLINSFRPAFALAAWLLTRLAGWNHPFWWHLTLDLSLFTGIAFTGLTARYVTGRWYVLQISIALYFVAFLPILNIFFWYSDLTFGLELAFTASAWYFGLRGLYEARIRFWLAAMALAIIAVLSKEPASVLVHVVLIGSFLLNRDRIIAEWKARPASHRYVAIASYAILFALSAWLAIVSPTRSNRFFAFSSPDLAFFIRDRIDYYSAIYLSITARLLLFSPIVYAFLLGSFRERMALPKFIRFSFITVLSVVLSVLLFQNVLIALPLVTFIFLVLFTQGREGGPSRHTEYIMRLLPFLACLLLAFAALLITIQLVKTQLTEAALLTAILSSWAWSVWIEDFGEAIEPYKSLTFFRRGAIAVGVLIAFVLAAGIWPRLASEERLLREVRDVRQNANDAIQWSAFHLPRGSLLAVTQYSLYGIDGAGALTPKPDETKLADQYTFDAGFVFDALTVLGRPDFRRTYLSDSIVLTRVLEAMRNRPHSYVLLQSQLDIDYFHGIPGNSPLLFNRDTLAAHFTRGPYPCEIWELRK